MAIHRDLAPPLGANVGPDGTTFAVFSASATAVELCLFEPGDVDGRTERRIPLRDRVNHIWSITLPEVGPGQRYAYRMHGPWRPAQGHRFNPDKLLLDPYAKAVEGEVRWAPELCGHEVGPDFQGSSEVQDHRDDAHLMPRCVVVEDSFDWGPATFRRVPWSDTVVYEAHVRGATMRHPGVPEHLRGTYAGLAHPAFVQHLLDLGVTTLELMPVHTFTDERHLAQMGMRNYWGYNTLGFFAPHAGYAAASDPQGVVDEVKSMVRTMHGHGIEVILDVVYNHTAEQGMDGATLSWRGIDNASYYRLDDWGHSIDVTGCGNTMNLLHSPANRMTLDSLRYWAREFHVDGFRFDLAVALARSRTDDYDRNHPFVMALRTDPVLNRLKLIAEPWDVGTHGWRTGQFPPPFREWNDRFRDTVRTFWLPDVATASANGHGVRELATRLSGSEDLFGWGDRGPSASINYVASHDGYTLADTCAYERKHNEANGEDNRDGHGDNRSWNHGVEGLTDDPEILTRRRRSVRNLLATTLLATGTPMICAGDEMGRTQRGNNNAYCQDNDTSWLDWSMDPTSRDLLATTRFLLRLRAEQPVLRHPWFFAATPVPGDERADVDWYGRYGEIMTPEAWEDPRCRVLQMFIHGEDIDAPSLLLVLQGKHVAEQVTLPPLAKGHAFRLRWDSTWETPVNAVDLTSPLRDPGSTHTLTAASIQVYEVVRSQPEDAPRSR